MEPHLAVRGLGLTRGGRALFRGLTFAVPRGSFVAVVGPSGSGKSSLLACLAGLLPPTEGTIAFCGGTGARHDAPGYQRRLGIVFQDFALSRQSSVLRNVLCGRLGRYGWWRTLCGFPRRDRAAARALLGELGLGAYEHRRAGEISGGEQQRAAIGRALFQEPEALLADEPVSNLDPPLARALLGRLRAQAREHGRTVVAVLHDLALVEEFADWTLRLDAEDPARWDYAEARGTP